MAQEQDCYLDMFAMAVWEEQGAMGPRGKRVNHFRDRRQQQTA